MLNKIKSIFCRHDFKFLGKGYNDNLIGKAYKVYECRKCGKRRIEQ